MPLVLGTGGAQAPAEVLAAGTGMTATDCSGYSIVPVSIGMRRDHSARSKYDVDGVLR